VLNRLKPLTYAVDPMRRLVFNHLDISEAARRTLYPGVTSWGWRVPLLVETGMFTARSLDVFSGERARRGDRRARRPRLYAVRFCGNGTMSWSRQQC